IMTERPVTGLNFVSLYPSIIMTYNLSSEKIILDREKADNVCKNKNELYTIEFKFNKYDIQAWCVRHENQFERKELYPAVLEDLSIKRLELKERLVSLGKKMQHLGKMISSAKERGKGFQKA
ncbi:7851_t:CDS:1, partial [Funneliformis geosporum]